MTLTEHKGRVTTMALDLAVYDAIEDLSTCMYALSENPNPIDMVDCVSLAVHTIDRIASKLGLEYRLPDVLSYTGKVRGVHELSEDEVSLVVNSLRKIFEGDFKVIKLALTILFNGEVPRGVELRDLFLALRASFLQTLRALEEKLISDVVLVEAHSEAPIS